jgi:hypothetical protein
MSILISLAPFAVCFVLMRLVSPSAGLTGALLASLVLCLDMWRRGASVKILELGGLVLFGLLITYTLLVAPRWSVATVRLVVDGGLLAMVLVSLAIGRPFTLQYARERVPKAFWSSPVFFATNRVITAVWAAAFAGLVVADAAAEYILAVPRWLDVATSIAVFAGAVWFTRWYPDVVRRRFGVAG